MTGASLFNVVDLEDRDDRAGSHRVSATKRTRRVPPHRRECKSRCEHDIAALMLCEEPFDRHPIVELMVLLSGRAIWMTCHPCAATLPQSHRTATVTSTAVAVWT